MSRFEAATLLSDAEGLVESLERVRPADRPQRFVRALRRTPLPFIACDAGASGAAAVLATFDVTHVLSGAALSFGVGFAAHSAVLSAIACHHVEATDSAFLLRRLLLDGIEDDRLLVSGAGPAPGGEPARRCGGVPARRISDGYVVRGRSEFAPWAAYADLVGFIGDAEDGTTRIMLTPFARNPRVRRLPGPGLGTLRGIGARSVAYQDVRIPESHAIGDGRPSDSGRTRLLLSTVRECLFAAAYLGVAYRAVEELRDFARRDRQASGFSRDAVVTELGRLLIRHRTAFLAAREATRGWADSVLPTASWWSLRRVMDNAIAARLEGMHTAEAIARVVRRRIGAKLPVPRRAVDRVLDEATFGGISADAREETEREVGHRFLSGA